MKKCPKCGKIYDDSKNFCISCGTALTSVIENNSTNSKEPNIPPIPSIPHTPPVPPIPKQKKSWLKRILIAVAILIAAFGFFVYYVMNAATYLRIEPDTLVATKGGGSIVVDIDYDGYTWNINHKPDWLDAETDEDNDKIKIIADNNLTGQNREGTITIQSGKQLAQISITQAGFASYIRASESALKFKKYGGSMTVDIDGDGCNWNVKSSDFISVTTEEGKIDIRVAENEGVARNGIIEISEDNVKCNIQVHQGGKCPSCGGAGETTCYMCGGTGGYYSYYCNSTCSWCNGTGKIKCSTCNGSGEVE